MTKTISITLAGIKNLSQEYTAQIAQELLFEFERELGPYNYNQVKDEIFWVMDSITADNFITELGQEYFTKLQESLNLTCK